MKDARATFVDTASVFAVLVGGISLTACASISYEENLPPYSTTAMEVANSFPSQMSFTPPHAAFVKALKAIDGEACRQAIDLCVDEVDRDNYDINAACGKFSKGRVRCLIYERRRDGNLRECKVVMTRTGDDRSTDWSVARDRIGSEPRALLATCNYK